MYIADLCFLRGLRPELVNTRLIEAEHSAALRGARQRDFKFAASGREVLGEGWGADTNSFAEYDVFIERPLAGQYLNVRFACWDGNGRDVRVLWNGASAGTFNVWNTGGWGERDWHFGWARCALPAMTAGWHRLRLTVDGTDSPVNLDCFTITEDQPWFRECEDFDSQVGSGGDDYKAGASAGEVLGMSWGSSALSEAVYHNVGTRALTNAWLHLWYALDSHSGRVVNVYVNGALKAELICARTGGWGSRASEFERVSAHLGHIGAGPFTIRLAVPSAGGAVNLDCFSIEESAPDMSPLDSDGDGLGDRQEAVVGTHPAQADTDLDGSTDGDEWLAGTDALDPDSFFQCLEISALNFPMSGKILRWPSATGRIYAVHFASNLLHAGFVPLSGSILATPPENAWTDTVNQADCIFYRIGARHGF
ncbi:MAG: Carbohydrate binding module (family 6) [Verrucomicrobia bacterium ADurb.Bin345]|nr:MAG: Carbohydrate binding module (family 6) [Verrucomicrobia bacterium ADurb.Bin345]